MPLYNIRIHGRTEENEPQHFVEGIVFTHPDGRMAKLRCDMFDWFKEESSHRRKKNLNSQKG